jgi:pimeloyl-ACP methyl ester carboxylesterase
MFAARQRIAEELERARAQMALGLGNKRLPFADFNGSLQITVMATPATYLSFFAPDSPAVMPVNAARLKAPLLLVAGDADPLQRGPGYIFARAPAHSRNRYVIVQAGHFDTSEVAAPAVIQWLAQLAQP